MNKNFFIQTYKHKKILNESIKIYINSFEESQRESIDKILKNINQGNYKMFSYLQDNEVVGFYILDINHKLNYTICTFLAVKESKRGLGIGAKLSLSAISYFHLDKKSHFFFIEAEDRQAKLYKKFGFNIMNFEYKVPVFNSNKSIKTNLMLMQKDTKIDTLSLISIIKDIFYRGYSLDKNDERIKQQLDKIKQQFLKFS